MAFNLNCQSPPRGSTGGGRVTTTDTAVTLASLTYAWETGAGVARPAGTGESLTRWEGTATSTLSMTVGISGPDIASKTLNRTVTVMPRTWAFPSGRTVAVYGTPHTRPWKRDEWGLFSVNIPEIVADSGTGPWQGTRYVSWPVEIIVAQLYIHPDLKPQDPAPAWVYETTGPVTAAQLRQDCRNYTQLDTVATVYRTNHVCGTGAARSSFHDPVKQHEEEHASRYETCRASQRIRDLLDQIEPLLGADTSEAERLAGQVESTMREGMNAGVAAVTSTGRFWHYRLSGGWVLDTATGLGHTGTACQ
ncbi:hypothetical protein [Candidatus Palauibacter sp.]|uniref:hypothetical protein n=1 Tax=Candidatus Palauibacter sp. TaxID=3101350 RepID=UPI003C6F79EC